jgi:transglutaminase-like putative cysteine protease
MIRRNGTISILSLVLCATVPVLWADVTTSAPATQPAGETEYSAIFMAGQKIGYNESTVIEQGGQVRTLSKMRLTIGRGDQAIRQASDTETLETSQGRPTSFRHKAVMGATPQVTVGRIEDGKLHLEITVAGKTTQRTIDWPAGAVLSYGEKRTVLEAGLEPGTTFTMQIFDASSLQAIKVISTVGEPTDVDILGTTRRLIPVSQEARVGSGSMQVTSYVDREWTICKSITNMMGMEMVQVVCDRAFALSPAESTLDFMSKTLIDVGRRLDIDEARQAWYRFGSRDGKAAATLPTIGPQRVIRQGDDTVVLVKAQRLEDLAGALPYDGSDADLKKALAPARYVQSDDPTIRELARKALGDATTAGQAAANICRFVHEYITAKDLSVGFASALDVAQTRQGDCTEHAVLAVALCRAAGIPARLAYGLVYIEQFQGRSNILGPHAWALVWVDGRWVTLDAAVLATGPRRVILSTGLGDEADFWSVITQLQQLQFRSAGCGELPRTQPPPQP